MPHESACSSLIGMPVPISVWPNNSSPNVVHNRDRVWRCSRKCTRRNVFFLGLCPPIGTTSITAWECLYVAVTMRINVSVNVNIAAVGVVVWSLSSQHERWFCTLHSDTLQLTCFDQHNNNPLIPAKNCLLAQRELFILKFDGEIVSE